MKKVLLAFISAAAFASAAHAQSTLYWDGSTTGGTTTTWDTTTTQWGTTSGGSPTTTWQSGDIADFTTTPSGNGTLTVNTSGPVSASGLYFGNSAGGYYIGNVNDAGGGAFNISGQLGGNNNNAMIGSYTGASSYDVVGAPSHSGFGSSNGIQLRGAKFDNSLVVGTGSDFGDVGVYGYSGGNVSLFTATGKSITVNNGWNLFLNSGQSASFTDTLNLNGLGAGNGTGGALVMAGPESWAGAINLQSDTAIVSGGATYLTTVSGAIGGSGNLYLGYGSTTAVTAGDGLVMASTSNTSTGNTILFTNFNGGVTTTTTQAVKLGATNALSQHALVLGETAGANTTLGDGTVITAANATISTYNSTTKAGGGSYQSANGALDMAGYNQQVSGLVVGGTQSGANQFIFNSSTASNSVSTLTINGNTTNTTTGFAGTIEDNAGSGGKVAVTMAGGAAKLSGANTYTGGTTVSGGVLTAGVASTSTTGAFGGPTGALAVSSTGTLALNGFSQTFGAMTLSGSGIVNFGATGTTLTASTLNWAGGASDFALSLGAAYVTTSALTVGSLTESGTPNSYTFNFTGGTVGTTYDIMNLTSLGSTAATDFTSTGESGSFSFSGNQLRFTLGATPEPSTWAMLLLGVGTLVFVRRARVGSRS